MFRRSRGLMFTVSLRGPPHPVPRNWKVWPCRCIGCHIGDWLSRTILIVSPRSTRSRIGSFASRSFIVHSLPDGRMPSVTVTLLAGRGSSSESRASRSA